MIELVVLEDILALFAEVIEILVFQILVENGEDLLFLYIEDNFISAGLHA